MAFASNIPSTPADGNIKTVVVTTLADPSKPSVTELNAGTDISCYITLGGFAYTTSQATISDQRECSDQDYQRPGRKSVSDASVTVIDNTNSELAEEYNGAVTAMAEGKTGYIVRRRGLPAADEWAADQTVTVIPVIFGEKQLVAQEENSVQRSQIPFFVTGEWHMENATVKAVS